MYQIGELTGSKLLHRERETNLWSCSLIRSTSCTNHTQCICKRCQTTSHSLKWVYNQTYQAVETVDQKENEHSSFLHSVFRVLQDHVIISLDHSDLDCNNIGCTLYVPPVVRERQPVHFGRMQGNCRAVPQRLPMPGLSLSTSHSPPSLLTSHRPVYTGRREGGNHTIMCRSIVVMMCAITTIINESCGKRTHSVWSEVGP